MGSGGGSAVQINTDSWYGTPTTVNGLKITSGSGGMTASNYIGPEAVGSKADLFTSEMLVKADWAASLNASLFSGSAVSEFYAAAPPAVVGGTVPNLFGFYIEPMTMTNVTTGWGVYQAGTSDQNYFAGNTIFGAGVSLAGSTVAGLPTCNTASKGSMRYVTDAAPSPVYNAVAAGGGSVRTNTRLLQRYTMD